MSSINFESITLERIVDRENLNKAYKKVISNKSWNNKENRHHDTHEYICDSCGYSSNDDRIGAMNLYELGTMYVSGDTNPRFGSRKVN